MGRQRGAQARNQIRLHRVKTHKEIRVRGAADVAYSLTPITSVVIVNVSVKVQEKWIMSQTLVSASSFAKAKFKTPRSYEYVHAP